MSIDEAVKNLPTYRLDQRRPAKGQKVMLIARDHLGPYPLNFACEWDGGGFLNSKTGRRLEVAIVSWRPCQVFDRQQTYKPSGVVLRTPRPRSRAA